VALAWTLRKPAVTPLIVGARTEEQLADNLAAANLELAADEVERLDKVSAPPLPYPFWHHLNASDRLSPADLSLLARHIKAR
jgi:diketogulonate reductase-like aldo/keto reductase